MKTVIRAGKATYYVFLIIWIVPLVLAIATVIRSPTTRSLWGMVCFVFVYGICLFVWVKRFKIECGEGRLRYTCLFGGCIEVSVRDVQSAAFELGIQRYCDRFLPPIRLVLTLKPNSKIRRLVINIKVFDRKQIDSLVVFLDANGVKISKGRKESGSH
jgi:hypothetical protein